MAYTPSEYLLDIAYTAQFHREHAPGWFDAVLTALGRTPPAATDPHWCEVGIGPGVGLAILAATNPGVTFHGIDINPKHIEQARELADAAGLANVVFHCVDLQSAQALPAFDYIVVRGLYSWVSPQMRQAIHRFAGQWLKPDGVALLHHLALPGAAELMAFHGLFGALHREAGLPAREAIRAGQDILRTLRDGKAGFFALHPAAALKTEQIMTDDVDHTIHDFLNDHYMPLPVAEVIAGMEAHGLALAGSAVPLDNLDDFTVPGNLRPLLQAQKHVAMRETIRDFACNKSFRIDLYTRNRAALAVDDHVAALRRQRFTALPGLPPKGGVTFDTQIGKVEGPAPLFSPVLERFARDGTVGYADIEALPAFAGAPGLVNQVLHALMGAGAIHPAPRQAPDPEPSRRLNALLLDRHRAGQRVPALAAPTLGSGIAIASRDLDALATGKPAAAGLRPLLA